jgi:molybdate transport system regulatory protein
MPLSRVAVRIELGEAARLGPGKVKLLELIAELGSISAAGRAMDMSYRRAWLLTESLNNMFHEPVVATQPGGRADQRAAITPFGRQVIRRYRSMEAKAHVAMADDLAILSAFPKRDAPFSAMPPDPRMLEREREEP